MIFKKKPAIYFPLAFPNFIDSVRSVKEYFENMGHICSHKEEGQSIMIGSDAGDIGTAELQFNLNHGFGAKNIYWATNGVTREKDRIQLVPSRWYKRRMERAGCRAEVVGMPRLDNAYRNRKTNTKKVLYAPTCHLDITSVPLVHDRVCALTEEGYEPLVKLHPELPIQIRQCDTLYGDKLVKDKDAGEYVAEADVVICDYATTMLDAIVLNKPTILIESPIYRHSKFYNRMNPEVIFSSCCYKAYNWREARDILLKIKSGYDPLERRRQIAAPFVCEHLGNAAEQVYKVVMDRWHK